MWLTDQEVELLPPLRGRVIDVEGYGVPDVPVLYVPFGRDGEGLEPVLSDPGGWFVFDEGGRSGAGGWRFARTTWKAGVAMPHGWAIAEMWLLVRDSLAFEEGGRLHLLSGVPPEWFTHAGGMLVEGLPTWFGTCSFAYVPSPTGAVVTLSGRASPPAGFVLALPQRIAARIPHRPARRFPVGIVALVLADPACKRPGGNLFRRT